MDSLVPVEVEEWPKLRDSFRKYQPYGIVGYNLMDTQITMQAMGLDCRFQVYCPYGDIANGMVAKITKDKLHQVAICANSYDTSKLEEALLSSKSIDWSEGRTEMPFVEPGTRMCLDRAMPKLGLQLVMEGPAHIYVFSRNRRPYENIRCPEGAYIAPVKLDNIPKVDSVWSLRYDSSEWAFCLFVKAGLSYGLYNSSDDSLMAWMFICETGVLCHLYCEEQHRRKGFAEFLVKYVTNDQVAKGKDVISYIVEGNVKSLELFSKLGYEEIGKASWIFYEKYPEGAYIAPVKLKNIPQVDRAWPHRYDSSEWVFSLFIKAGLSYGLYSSSDDSLMAWMFICEAGFLCHLYCEEQHRRKGYAEFVVKYVTNDQVTKGKDVFCYIVEGNIKSLELFSKLGYEEIGKTSWVFYEKL